MHCDDVHWALLAVVGTRCGRDEVFEAKAIRMINNNGQGLTGSRLILQVDTI